MQKKIRSKLVSLLFVVVCTTVCASCLYLFWRDLNAFTVRSDKDEIATITFKHNIAQRKFNDRLVWERLQQESPLYDADTIRTADNSQARIKFSGGLEIEVADNSMLQIFRGEDGTFNISINGGNVTVDTTNVETSEAEDFSGRQKDAPAVKVTMENGSQFNLNKGSRVQALASDEGENVFVMQEGNATVKDENGNVSEVNSGESVKVEKTGTMSRGKITVTSVSRDLKVLNVDDSAKDIVLEWNASEELKDSEVVVEVSKDKNFSSIEKTYSRKGSSSVTIEQPQGEVYWRVYTPEDKSTSVDGKINSSMVSKPALISPVDKAGIKFRKDKPKVSFAWDGNNFADFYKIQVFLTENYDKPVYEKEVKGNKLNVVFNKAGSYCWKITPHYAVNDIGFAGESEMRWFDIIQLKTDDKPGLSLPADGSKYTLSTKDVPFTFTWKSYAEDASFDIVVSDSPDFEKTVYTANTSNQRVVKDFNINTLPEGTYYWKVIRSSPEDENGVSESDVRKIEIARYVPGEIKLVFPNPGYMAEKEKFAGEEFSWKMAEEFKSEEYKTVLQISRTKDFSKIIAEINETESHVKSPDLNAGTYYWRVKAVNDSTGETAATSKFRSFEILSPLASPVIDASVSAKEQILLPNSTVNISWSSASGCDYYSYKLIDSEGKIVSSGTSATTNHFFEIPEISDGEKKIFRVSVQSVCEESGNAPFRISEPGTAEFTVRRAVPVRLVTPKNNARMDGLTALRSPVVLEFAKGDDYTSSTLVLKKILSNGTEKTVSTINNPKFKTTFKRLSSGNYEWTVIASDKNGNDLSSPEKGTFTVSPVPELEKPVLVNPQNKYVITSAYLKENRSITFDWNDVPDATDYKFVLYIKNEDGTLKKLHEEVVKKSELKYTDLKKLDIKDFIWRVTAYTHAKDGFEERKSSTSSSSFKISFQLPQKIKTIDPGTQYAE